MPHSTEVAAAVTAGIPAVVLAAQATFRAAMDATARPGTIHTLAASADAPPPLMPAAVALALALFDADTPVWLDATGAAAPAVADWLRFHTGAPLTADRAASAFALIADAGALTSLDGFALGSDDYPDRSTTLIVQVASLAGGLPVVLSGPGIKDTVSFAPVLPPGLFARLAATRPLFPRGLDLILVAGDRIAAVPRTSHLSIGED